MYMLNKSSNQGSTLDWTLNVRYVWPGFDIGHPRTGFKTKFINIKINPRSLQNRVRNNGGMKILGSAEVGGSGTENLARF